MRYTNSFLLLLLFSCFGFGQVKSSDWEPLFNGKNLDGWIPKIRTYALNDNFANTFRVEDGLLKVRYDQGYEGKFQEKFGHIFYKKEFSHYRLAVEYRFVDNQIADGPGWATRNSGVMVHCQPPSSMLRDQDFPISIEVQFLGGLGKGARSTCNLCTPGTNVVYNGKLDTRHCINSSSKTYDGDQWVKAEVLVLGDSLIQHFVNGEKVLEYKNPTWGNGNVEPYDPTYKIDGMPVAKGYISLQSESHPIDFRKVEILNLCGCMDKKAINYRPYFVKADNKLCTYRKKRSKS